MGEIFPRERAKTELHFTGERMTGSIRGQIEIEHLHRYFLAREMARGQEVLEIACGEGYGAAMMAQVATSVLGMDVSIEAVAHAARNYKRDNLRFALGDARKLDAPDASVDLLTSFETLEHFYEHELFYAEARRVLRPGGKLLISTPEREVYSPEGSRANMHHVRELSRAEFEAGLRAVFPHVVLMAQRPMIGSVLVATEPAAAEPRTMTFEQRGEDAFETNEGLPRGVYLVAVCSDQPVTVPLATHYIATSRLDWQEQHWKHLGREEEREVQSREKEALRQALNAEAAETARVLREELDHRIARERELLAERDHALAVLRDAEASLEAIHRSTSWRLTAPLRRMLGRA